MSLDETIEDDIVKLINGIEIRFDQMIYEHTKDLTLELKVTPTGKGLVITGNESNC